jgi:outer membrane lipoprotein-sorting protein
MRPLALLGIGLALLRMGWVQERPIEWLQRAVRAEQTLTVSGERVTEFQRGEQRQRIAERFWRQGARAIRIEVMEPAARRGEILLFRGDKWLLYRPDAKEAVVLPMAPPMHEMMLKRLLLAVQRQAMRLTMQPPESVLNRPCVVLMVQPEELPPKPPAPPFAPRRDSEPIQSITLWIDRATGLVLRREVRFRHAESMVRVEFTRLELPDRLAPELFQLPAGVSLRNADEGRFESLEEAQKAAGFALRLPDYLPSGTKRESIVVRRIRGRTLVAIRYHCPQGDFTFFQTLAPHGDFQLPRPPRHRPLNAYFWRAGDYWFGLVGDLPQAEMERIARSVPK